MQWSSAPVKCGFNRSNSTPTARNKARKGQAGAVSLSVNLTNLRDPAPTQRAKPMRRAFTADSRRRNWKIAAVPLLSIPVCKGRTRIDTRNRTLQEIAGETGDWRYTPQQMQPETNGGFDDSPEGPVENDIRDLPVHTNSSFAGELL